MSDVFKNRRDVALGDVGMVGVGRAGLGDLRSLSNLNDTVFIVLFMKI